MKTKILIYTHKTSFINNWINPLQSFLFFDIVIFHINSIDNEKIPKMNNIVLYDISELSVKKISKIISEINPKYTLFLGYRSLAELFLLRLCKNLKIKTVYLEHGLYTHDTKKINKKRLIKDTKKTVKKYSLFILKFAQLMILYSIKEISHFYQCFIKNNYSKNRFDEALFFSEYGFKGLNQVFNYSEKDVYYCGYPLFKEASQINYSVKQSNDVLYVHQPFILNKQAKISYEEEIEYILNMKNKLSNTFDKFTVLLHPREDLGHYERLLHEHNIDVIQRPNDYTVFLDKRLVIGHYSTALLYPLFFQIKTIIVDYPSVKIDPIFTNYCDYFTDTTQLKVNMNDKKAAQVDISNLLGPHNTYKNIADILNKL